MPLVLLALTACTLRSGLGVPPGEAFVLGDNPHGPYVARVENVGAATVVLRATGGATRETTLAPGASARLRFPADTTVQVINDTDTAARLDVRARGDVGLSMAYVPVPTE